MLAAAPALAAISRGQVLGLQGKGAQIMDTRRTGDFAAGHLPGSLSIALRPAFATWLGWPADPQRPVIIVRSKDQDPEEITWAAAKVGFDALAGELDTALTPRDGTGTTLASALIGPGHLLDGAAALPSILDVRQASEFRAGHIPGARNVELGALAGHLSGLPAGPLVVMCRHRERGS